MSSHRVDALGFILGTGIALRTGKGLVVARKGGKMPVACDGESFVDEWAETGAQIRAPS
jgi:adenine/guanine phosphoribosyltransferase-like PRPP-binding protein